MIRRIHVNNFRCFENFNIDMKGLNSGLLIGKSGSGKTSVSLALEILQKIGRGINRVGHLVSMRDLSKNTQRHVPIRIEIEVLLKEVSHTYSIAFELPENFKEFRIFEESLSRDGETIFSRKNAQVALFGSGDEESETRFMVDWHLAALPVIQEPSEASPIHAFKTWLSRMIILRPIPRRFSGESDGETMEPHPEGIDFGRWLSGLLSAYPASYNQLERHLRAFMPDFQDFRNEKVSKNSKYLTLTFKGRNDTPTHIDFEELSDGEKCFFLCAMVISANQYYGPLFCFWDEPDHHLSLSEVGYFIGELRRSFEENGQIIATSHNPEAIRRFSEENTLFLHRKNHLEPVQARFLFQIPRKGTDIVHDLLLDEIEL